MIIHITGFLISVALALGVREGTQKLGNPDFFLNFSSCETILSGTTIKQYNGYKNIN